LGAHIIDQIMVRGLMGAMDDPSPNADPHSLSPDRLSEARRTGSGESNISFAFEVTQLKCKQMPSRGFVTFATACNEAYGIFGGCAEAVAMSPFGTSATSHCAASEFRLRPISGLVAETLGDPVLTQLGHRRPILP